MKEEKLDLLLYIKEEKDEFKKLFDNQDYVLKQLNDLLVVTSNKNTLEILNLKTEIHDL